MNITCQSRGSFGAFMISDILSEKITVASRYALQYIPLIKVRPHMSNFIKE